VSEDVSEMPFSMTVQTRGLLETERHSVNHNRNLANHHRMLRCTEEVVGSCSFSEMLVFNITDAVTRVSRPPVERPSTRTTEAGTDLRLLTMSKISYSYLAAEALSNSIEFIGAKPIYDLSYDL